VREKSVDATAVEKPNVALVDVDELAVKLRVDDLCQVPASIGGPPRPSSNDGRLLERKPIGSDEQDAVAAGRSLREIDARTPSGSDASSAEAGSACLARREAPLRHSGCMRA
jgi:hypothetical protein